MAEAARAKRPAMMLGMEWMEALMRDFTAMQEKIAELEGAVALSEEATSQRMKDFEYEVQRKHSNLDARVIDVETQMCSMEDSLLETMDKKVDSRLAQMEEINKSLEGKRPDSLASTPTPTRASEPEVVPRKAQPIKKAPPLPRQAAEKAPDAEAAVTFKAVPAKRPPPARAQQVDSSSTEDPEPKALPVKAAPPSFQQKDPEAKALPVKAPPANLQQKAPPPSPSPPLVKPPPAAPSAPVPAPVPAVARAPEEAPEASHRQAVAKPPPPHLAALAAASLSATTAASLSVPDSPVQSAAQAPVPPPLVKAPPAALVVKPPPPSPNFAGAIAVKPPPPAPPAAHGGELVVKAAPSLPVAKAPPAYLLGSALAHPPIPHAADVANEELRAKAPPSSLQTPQVKAPPAQFAH